MDSAIPKEPTTDAEYMAEIDRILEETKGIREAMRREHAETERLKVESRRLKSETDIIAAETRAIMAEALSVLATFPPNSGSSKRTVETARR